MEVWRVIENRNCVPKKKVNRVEVPKAQNDWTEEEDQKIEVNYKAINNLLCAVNANEFKKLSRYHKFKEMWEKLQITHEGTNEVRKTRTDNLEEEFDNFKMRDDETIEEMFDKLGEIAHELDLMGVLYDHEKIVRKVLKNLIGPWKIKATTIEESRKTTTMTTNEQQGKLIAYKKTYLRRETEELN